MITATRCVVFAVAVTAMSLADFARAAEPAVVLQRNPFDRPEADVLIGNSVPASRGPTSEGDPFLRGILSAGPKSVVNFGGVILQIGESAKGFRLLSVEEGEATFSRDGEKVVFSLHKPEQAENQ
jgi:hypothetical protein